MCTFSYLKPPFGELKLNTARTYSSNCGKLAYTRIKALKEHKNIKPADIVANFVVITSFFLSSVPVNTKEISKLLTEPD